MASSNTILTGITWNHTRGVVPMIATAQRYSELHTDVEIEWSARTLQQFADQPLDELVKDYDLLIIDHPWVGYVAETEILVPLDEHLPGEYLEDQSDNSVGASYQSYSYGGHQWALPVDAAAPVAASRPDLLEEAGAKLPETMQDLLALADRGLVAFPAIPIDTLMNFYMLCITFGEEPFGSDEQVVSEEIGLQALQFLKRLASKVDPACFERNPIKTYEAMTQGDDIAYCPFAYGYINYARRNYARKRLQFHNLVTMNGQRLRSTLGGTGLAVSAGSDHIETACEYAQLVASPACQQSMYTETGGQPAHKLAWTSDYANNLCEGYLRDTLPTLEHSFLRPRYSGYLHFQDHAGSPIREYLMNGGEEHTILEKINSLYKESLS